MTLPRAAILLFLVAILFLWRNGANPATAIAIGYSEPVLSKIEHHSGETEDTLVLKFTRPPPLPHVHFQPEEGSWIIDLLKTQVRSPLYLPRKYSGAIKLIAWESLGTKQTIQRIRVFTKNGVGMKIRSEGESISLVFRPEDHFDQHRRRSTRAAQADYALLAPTPHAPGIVIDLQKGSKVWKVIQRLSKMTGRHVRFRDFPPQTSGLTIEQESPEAALRAIAEALNMVMSDEGDVMTFSRRDNILLHVPLVPLINGTALIGKSMEEVLLTLAGPQVGSNIAERFPEDVRAQVLENLIGNAAPRQWVEHLLDAHGVTT